MASADNTDGKGVATISIGDIKFEEKITGHDNVAFSNIPLDEEKQKGKKKKVPRRILHFSDGILEEYSTDEEDEEPQPPPVNPKTLTWLPWFWYYLVFVASGALGVADTCGEKLAWFFGITSPKYQYAIDEYHRLKAEEEEERKRSEREAEAARRREAEEIEDMEGSMGESVYKAQGDNVSITTQTTEVGSITTQQPAAATPNDDSNTNTNNSNDAQQVAAPDQDKF